MEEKEIARHSKVSLQQLLKKKGAFSNLNALSATGIYNHETGKVNVPLNSLEKVFQTNIVNENMKIPLAEIKKRVALFNPRFPLNELNIIFKGKQELSMDELKQILTENQLEDIDPMQESIKLLLDKRGRLDFEKIKHFGKELGYPSLTKKDIEILHECLDADKDGIVSGKDFHDILEFMNMVKKSEGN